MRRKSKRLRGRGAAEHVRLDVRVMLVLDPVDAQVGSADPAQKRAAPLKRRTQPTIGGQRAGRGVFRERSGGSERDDCGGAVCGGRGRRRRAGVAAARGRGGRRLSAGRRLRVPSIQPSPSAAPDPLRLRARLPRAQLQPPRLGAPPPPPRASPPPPHLCVCEKPPRPSSHGGVLSPQTRAWLPHLNPLTLPCGHAPANAARGQPCAYRGSTWPAGRAG